MASRIPAIRRRSLQVVIVLNVALGAWHVGVPGRQRKSRAAVIERRRQPGIESVAALAIC